MSWMGSILGFEIRHDAEQPDWAYVCIVDTFLSKSGRYVYMSAEPGIHCWWFAGVVSTGLGVQFLKEYRLIIVARVLVQ